MARPVSPPPTRSIRRYLRMAPADMALAKFLLEAWGHLGYFTTVDPRAGVAKLVTSPDMEYEAQRFLDALATEIEYAILPLPQSVS